jgi:photosystem II stability/assembly factor-like uncharacterized protein
MAAFLQHFAASKAGKRPHCQPRRIWRSLRSLIMGGKSMASPANVYASVAGTVGRSDKDPGKVGVFRRPAESGEWEHVISDFSSNVVHVHPTDPNIVLAGTHDGVYRSTDRGKTFKRANFPDKSMEIWSFLVDAGNPKLIYAGGSPIAVYRSEDSGETWKRLPDPNMPSRCVMPFACRVMRMAQHPGKPGTIFAALEVGGVMRTTDGGETWKDCSPDLIRLAQLPHLKSKIVSNTSDEGMLDGHAIAISKADPDAVIVAVRMGLFRTADDGDSWQDMEVGRFSPTTYGREVRSSPSEPGAVYSALSVAAASKDGAVYKSTDKGQTWKRFDKVQVHGTIMSVALHQTDPKQVYIGARYDGEIFGTQDGGETWQSMNLPSGTKDIYALACG